MKIKFNKNVRNRFTDIIVNKVNRPNDWNFVYEKSSNFYNYIAEKFNFDPLDDNDVDKMEILYGIYGEVEMEVAYSIAEVVWADIRFIMRDILRKRIGKIKR